jgi:transcriptional regulator with XRE-family HTH domain
MVQKGHSKSTFAKVLDVSLPLITHITTGRNKPGIDLIQKILIEFQEVNPRWLLLGEEEMENRKVEMPDMTDIQVELNKMKIELLSSKSGFQMVKEYHKILMDEILYLQEIQIQLNDMESIADRYALKIEHLKDQINIKLKI